MRATPGRVVATLAVATVLLAGCGRGARVAGGDPVPTVTPPPAREAASPRPPSTSATTATTSTTSTTSTTTATTTTPPIDLTGLDGTLPELDAVLAGVEEAVAAISLEETEGDLP